MGVRHRPHRYIGQIGHRSGHESWGFGDGCTVKDRSNAEGPPGRLHVVVLFAPPVLRRVRSGRADRMGGGTVAVHGTVQGRERFGRQRLDVGVDVRRHDRDGFDVAGREPRPVRQSAGRGMAERRPQREQLRVRRGRRRPLPPGDRGPRGRPAHDPPQPRLPDGWQRGVRLPRHLERHREPQQVRGPQRWGRFVALPQQPRRCRPPRVPG